MTREPRQPKDDFIRNVLARTSGSSCRKACDLLPDLQAGALDDLDRRLVQAHLEHCAECRAVAVVLGWVQPVLLEMAELDPGPAFTRAVVARTSEREKPSSRATGHGQAVGPLVWVDQWGRWWQKQFLRPRFALEFSYVVTVLLVLLTAMPGAPLGPEARRAQAMIQGGPLALPLVGPLLTEEGRKVDQALSQSRARVQEQGRGLVVGLRTRWQRTGESRQQLWQDLVLAWQQARKGRLRQTVYQISEAGGQVPVVWSRWRGDKQVPERKQP